MSDDHEKVLRAAWDSFCDELKRAGEGGPAPGRSPAA